MNRRTFLPIAGIAATAGYAGLNRMAEPQKAAAEPPGNSAVTIIRAGSYAEDLESKILEGLKTCQLDVKGKRVLLKPNLVEFDPSTVINTNPALIAAAFHVFQRLGAAEVRIGEGPGHRRDTYALAEQAGYRSTFPEFDRIFTDLNRDDVSPVSRFANQSRLYFPNTALAADLIVSLPKMKTHHWAGVTLSMKNFFGLVPGAVYGWPKNQLHLIGITESILALQRTFRKTFAIVDGIVGMEGNGPIQGSPKNAGVLVMGRDLPAVDATCCRLMGIAPEKVEHLRLATEFGHIQESRIEQRGETILQSKTEFRLIDAYRDLRAARS